MKATKAARTATALIATLILATGCTSGAPASAGGVSHTVSRSSLVKVSYGTWGFTAMHPEAWRSYPYEAINTMGGTIGYLSTDQLRDPCLRTANSISCEQERVLATKLSSAGVLLRWGEIGRPGITSISDFPGDPLVVDGSPARLGTPSPATDDCQAVGGSVEIAGTVLRRDAGESFLQLDACLGPNAGTAAELDVDAVFRSLTFISG